MTPPASAAPAPNPATIWARVLVDELVRGGVHDICLAPGSRSTPLVLAAARRHELRLRVFIDERSAAFFALGLGKATRQPAVVLTTSGTAVANLLPAAVEASQAEVPLVLLTADRPPRLRDLDANQAIEQRGIFGDYPRWQADLALPTLDDAALRHLRGQVCRALGMARGLPAGPVHVNVPFEKPLEPTPADDVTGTGEGETGREPGWTGRPSGAPFTRVGEQRPRVSDAELAEHLAQWSSAERGVIVAGPHPEADRLGPALRAFARRSGFVLLADPLSGARWGIDNAGALSAADLWLGAEGLDKRLAPDRVLRVGAVPTSSRVLGWLERQTTAPQVVIDAGGRWKDSPARAHELIRACPIDLFERALASWRTGSAGATASRGRWSELWRRLDAVALQAVAELAGVDEDGGAPTGVEAGEAGSDLLEAQVARAVVDALPASVPLFVSSSMPVRDVDTYGGQREGPLSVQGNRGASGIDGIVSTTLGLSAGRAGADLDRRVVGLVGDLAFLHDLNGLLATREPDAGVVFVVVNNDGGGIFHMLPIAEHEPDFTPYFATPHGLDLSRAAALFGVPYQRVRDGDALRQAITMHLRDMALELAPEGTGGGARVEAATDAGAGGWAPRRIDGAPRSVIIEVCTERAANRIARDRVRAEAERGVLEALRG